MRDVLKAAVVFVVLAGAASAQQTVRLSIDPGTVVNRVDEKIYGHFLEHIYHSCNGGLWGDLVWNRSFEQNAFGQWSIQGEQVVQEGMGTNVRLTFGDASWTDYEYTLEAKKTAGQEGFLILFRVKSDRDFYWCNLGGWNNERHALERGLASENRWGVVGPQPRGRIETDKWYAIKVRCEGRRFQVWLGEERVIDHTDDERAHLSGKVGVGTWATQAVFRNLKVASLDGTVLYEGLPRGLTTENAASSWQAYDGAKAYIDRADPLNSSTAQRIVTGPQGGGLQQAGFCVRSGETYQGSLWARGTAKQGLIVKLVDDAGQEVVLPMKAPTSKWQEFTFALRPEWSCADAKLCVEARGESEIWIDQVSVMPKSWKEKGGFRPDLLQAVAELRPPIIRWPGGCFASSYQWKQGIGPQHKRLPHPREIWDDLDVNNYGTDEFIETCRRVGAEPLIVVNIGSPAWNNDSETHDYTQDILDWIEYCNGPADSKWGKVRAANGHPEPYRVKYWEIDNETWHTPAERYAEQVLRIAPLMKKADPSIKLAACGSGGLGRSGSGMAYNRTVIEKAAAVIDYISIHHYEDPDRFARGPLNYERFFREVGEVIAASGNPKLRIYVSEWNAQSTDWRTGLYCGGLLNAFERCGDILEIGGPALFLRHVSATAWDNAFINFDQCSWFPAPNYVVMKLWRDHYAPERVAVTGEAGPLNVSATRRPADGAVIVKVVNPGREPVSLELSLPANASAAKAQVVAPGSTDARNTLAEPERVKAEDLAVRTDGAKATVGMPALSAAVITITTDK
jgi:alpha-N-arabinofuranosidase